MILQRETALRKLVKLSKLQFFQLLNEDTIIHIRTIVRIKIDEKYINYLVYQAQRN